MTPLHPNDCLRISAEICVTKNYVKPHNIRIDFLAVYAVSAEVNDEKQADVRAGLSVRSSSRNQTDLFNKGR